MWTSVFTARSPAPFEVSPVEAVPCILGGTSGYSDGKERVKVKGWDGGLRCMIVFDGSLEIIWTVSSSNMAEMASISSVRARFEVVVEDMRF